MFTVVHLIGGSDGVRTVRTFRACKDDGVAYIEVLLPLVRLAPLLQLGPALAHLVPQDVELPIEEVI